MAGGFGAGFLTLTLLAVIGGVAAVLVALGGTAWVVRRRSGSRRTIRALAALLSAAAVVPAGFGVLALADESAVGAGLLMATVFVPLGAALLQGRAGAGERLEPIATAGLAWGGPYLLAVATFVGITAVVPSALGLAPAEARAVGVGPLAVAAAGAVATAGTLLLRARLARLVRSA